MPEKIKSVERLKAKSAADSKYDPTDMLTAFQDIVLTIGNARTETDHQVKMIAERAIAKAQKR
jgi:hypothetical protein